jgi:hypothetical protein
MWIFVTREVHAGVAAQQYISAVQRGGIRLDTLQLRRWLHACGSNLESFGAELERNDCHPLKRRRERRKLHAPRKAKEQGPSSDKKG